MEDKFNNNEFETENNEFEANKEEVINEVEVQDNEGLKNKKKNKKIKGKIFLSLLLIAVLFITGITQTLNLMDRFGIKVNNKNTKVDTVTKLNLSQFSKEDNSPKLVSKIVENVMPSIVSIAVESYKYDYFNQPIAKQVGNGTGFIVRDNKDSLYIATNNHVIGNAQKIGVTFVDNSTVQASVVGTEKDEDLALIEVKKRDIQDTTLKTIKVSIIGKSSELKIGEDVIAIGNALGYGQSVSKGIISALNRGQNIGANFLPLIQTDAAINPGNSGGPLVNLEGQVVGINSIKLASNEIEGIGYAIPSDIFVPELEHIKNGDGSSQVHLGVNGKFIDEQVASAYDMPIGLYIMSVESESLRLAGIKKGDIITKIAGEDVINIKNIQRILRRYKVGDEVELTVYKREGDTVKIKVKLGEKPNENN